MSTNTTNNAAKIIISFMRKVQRCWITGRLIPISKKFFTSQDVCCHIDALVRHFVRATCVDEIMDITPRCIVRNSIIPLSSILVLCRRAIATEDLADVRSRIANLIKSNGSTFYPLIAWDHIADITCTASTPLPSILLFRMGWELLKLKHIDTVCEKKGSKLVALQSLMFN